MNNTHPPARPRMGFFTFFCGFLPAYAALTLLIIYLASGLPKGVQAPLFMAWGIIGMAATFYALGKKKPQP